MKQAIKEKIEETDEGKAIIKAYLNGTPINKLVELIEYAVIELWLGEFKALCWLDMLESMDPCELEKYLEEG